MREEIDAIRTRVWFYLLQMMTKHWDNAVKIARRVEDKKQVKKAAGGGWSIPRDWHWYPEGKRDPTPGTLERVEPRFPRSSHFYRHDFWRLLRKTPPAGEQLLAIIRQLPPRYVACLLEDPDPVTGRVAIRTTLALADVEAVQRLGSLDALAGLLALYLLAVEHNDANAQRLASLCGFRLFSHITSFHPFHFEAARIWRIAVPRFFEGMPEAVRLEHPMLTAGAGRIEQHRRLALTSAPVLNIVLSSRLSADHPSSGISRFPRLQAASLWNCLARRERVPLELIHTC